MTPQQCRVAFKSWPVEKQRVWLKGLLEEHAYYSGLAGMSLETELVSQATMQERFNEGLTHKNQCRMAHIHGILCHGVNRHTPVRCSLPSGHDGEHRFPCSCKFGEGK